LKPAVWYRPTKRALDLLVAAGLIAVTAPVLLGLSLLVRIDSQGPALFRQSRLGMHGTPFTIYKFRTMKVNTEHSGSGIFTSVSDPRITRVGAWLRASSLDELPQLLNVLRGEMSLIGPRPPLVDHPYSYHDYPREFLRRFEVRPGVSGLAQVSGRNKLTWDERLALDVEYANRMNPLLDAYIFMKTFKKAVNRREIYNLSEDSNVQ
jgi:undecaprenyl phosphate N,N'-diacetylbacillosamine 1-phosphate transferase